MGTPDLLLTLLVLAVAVGWAAAYFGIADQREARARRLPPATGRVILNGGFRPGRLEVPAGRPLELHITRAGDGGNGWMDLDFPYIRIQGELAAGETATLLVPELEPGEYSIFADGGRLRAVLEVVNGSPPDSAGVRSPTPDAPHA